MPSDIWSLCARSLPPSWEEAIGPEFEKLYMRDLVAFLTAERAAGKAIYPDAARTFAALQWTALTDVKAVILGQDPYHQREQAIGLSFSVAPGVKPPPSLRNIYKELAGDLGITPPSHGCLTAWAARGVLLLNSSLSVEEGKPASHAGMGWNRFTNAVLAAVNAKETPVVFLLWGNHARARASMLDASRHLVLQSEHPSPLSAYRGFFGSRPFSKANAFLSANGIEPVDWSLPLVMAETIEEAPTEDMSAGYPAFERLRTRVRAAVSGAAGMAADLILDYVLTAPDEELEIQSEHSLALQSGVPNPDGVHLPNGSKEAADVLVLCGVLTRFYFVDGLTSDDEEFSVTEAQIEQGRRDGFVVDLDTGTVVRDFESRLCGPYFCPTDEVRAAKKAVADDLTAYRKP